MIHTWRHFGLAVLLAFGLTGCGGDEAGVEGWGSKGDSESKKKAPAVTVVELAEVARGDVRDTLAANAVVESEAAADVIPMTSGIVVSLHKDEGDAVRKGDLLAVLDNVSLDASAERAAAEVDRLEGQFTEMEELAARGAVSDRELSDLEFSLRNARTSLREAASTHGQTRLIAPFDGVVAARDVRVGELAGGSTAAFRVVDLHQLRVVAQVPERDLSRVAIGQPAVLTSAYDDEITSTGVVRRIAPVVDSGSGTFRVTIEVDPDQTALRPGQYVGIDIEVDRKPDVTVVRSAAIVYEAGAPVVYVYDVATEDDLKPPKSMGGMGGWGGGGEEGDAEEEDAEESWWASLFGGDEEAEEEEEDPADVYVARRRPVEVGLADDELSEIIKGVEVGERVVTVGQSPLRDGVRLRDVLDPLPEKSAEEEDVDGTEADAGESGSDVEDHG